MARKTNIEKKLEAELVQERKKVSILEETLANKNEQLSEEFDAAQQAKQMAKNSFSRQEKAERDFNIATENNALLRKEASVNHARTVDLQREIDYLRATIARLTYGGVHVNNTTRV